MLLDVLSACLPLGTPLVVTDDRAGAELAVEIGAAVCADPGGGQGPAVAAALDRLGSGPALVVNADVPSVTARDLRTLAAATPPHGIALVAAVGRHDERAVALVAVALRAALRTGQRGPVLRPRSGARRRGRGDPAPRRRRRRPRRPATARPRRGTTDAGRPRRPRARRVNVAVLSGGVGGARFLRGLVEVIPPDVVAVIGNVADDVEILGLHVSPDLDSILYALTGLADEERGWGRADESWHALDAVAALGGEAWFRLGDRDLGLHLVRTEALREGEPLSAVTARLRARSVSAYASCRRATTPCAPGSTRPRAPSPSRPGSSSAATATRWTSATRGPRARTPARASLEALDAADVIVIAPSNPYVSIGPILAVPAIRSALETRAVPAVAVSPLVGGRAVKARPTGCSPASPAEPLPPTSPRSTRG